jgi:hypothetical protein
VAVLFASAPESLWCLLLTHAMRLLSVSRSRVKVYHCGSGSIVGCSKTLSAPFGGASEEDGEWLDALAEASSFMDVGCVDEGLDLSNDFGI